MVHGPQEGVVDRQGRAAVVFDFDGTLVESTHGLLEATNRLLVEGRRQALTLSQMQPMLGGGAPRLVEHAFRFTGAPPVDLGAAVERWRVHYDGCASECTVLFPGIPSVLEALASRGLALGICTCKPVGSTLKLLHALGIRHFFASVQGQDSTPTPKPHPGHLLAVLTELGVEPELAVMVGDREQDVSMARAARAHVVLITHGRADVPCAGGPDGIAASPAELGPVLDRLLRDRCAASTTCLHLPR